MGEVVLDVFPSYLNSLDEEVLWDFAGVSHLLHNVLRDLRAGNCGKIFFFFSLTPCNLLFHL